MRTCLLAGVLLAAAGIAADTAAQSSHQPTRYPGATAAGREWYTSRAPLYFSGNLYYPAGPTRHFDGDVMVRTGSFEGVPLFADTSIEPYSEILVPIGRGLVHPYERRREGDLAGTTGSRAPSFPVRLGGSQEYEPGQPWPGQYRQPAPPHGTQQPEPQPQPQQRDESLGRMMTARPPHDNRGIWIRYEGTRWESAGEAVERDGTFSRIGEYRGFPVYTRGAAGAAPREIFIPSRDEMLAPYRRASDAPGT